MRAVAMQQPGTSGTVAKQHEVLAEDPHNPRQLAELLRHRDRLPIPAEVLTARGSAADVGELRILLGGPHLVIALEARGARSVIHGRSREIEDCGTKRVDDWPMISRPVR